MELDSSPKPPAGHEKYLVPVLMSAFRVLEEISGSESLSLTEVIAKTGVPKSTAFRILTTLHHLGYLGRDEARKYHSTPRLGDLVTEASLAEGLRQICIPHMVRLRDEFGETVNLGRLHQGLVHYLEVVPSEYALRLHEMRGATVNLHASGLGKAILAFSPAELAENLLRDHELQPLTENTVTDPDQLLAQLDEIRRLGYARDHGETTTFATCIAAPILDARNRAVAAISISGPTSRFNPPSQSDVVEALLKTTAAISEGLQRPGDGAAATDGIG